VHKDTRSWSRRSAWLHSSFTGRRQRESRSFARESRSFASGHVREGLSHRAWSSSRPTTPQQARIAAAQLLSRPQIHRLRLLHRSRIEVTEGEEDGCGCADATPPRGGAHATDCSSGQSRSGSKRWGKPRTGFSAPGASFGNSLAARMLSRQRSAGTDQDSQQSRLCAPPVGWDDLSASGTGILNRDEMLGILSEVLIGWPLGIVEDILDFFMGISLSWPVSALLALSEETLDRIERSIWSSCRGRAMTSCLANLQAEADARCFDYCRSDTNYEQQCLAIATVEGPISYDDFGRGGSFGACSIDCHARLTVCVCNHFGTLE